MEPEHQTKSVITNSDLLILLSLLTSANYFAPAEDILLVPTLRSRL